VNLDFHAFDDNAWGNAPLMWRKPFRVRSMQFVCLALNPPPHNSTQGANHLRNKKKSPPSVMKLPQSLLTSARPPAPLVRRPSRIPNGEKGGL